jgi:hypothetical protein
MPVVDRQGNVHYQVEAIVAQRRNRHTRQLLVKWLGYPDSQSSWEPRERLIEDCPDLVLEWESAHPDLAH